MKKTLLLAIFVLFVVFASNVPLVRAQAGSMMGNQAGSTSTTPGNNMQVESVEAVLQEILGQQKVSTIQQLDLSKISDDDWDPLTCRFYSSHVAFLDIYTQLSRFHPLKEVCLPI